MPLFGRRKENKNQTNNNIPSDESHRGRSVDYGNPQHSSKDDYGNNKYRRNEDKKEDKEKKKDEKKEDRAEKKEDRRNFILDKIYAVTDKFKAVASKREGLAKVLKWLVILMVVGFAIFKFGGFSGGGLFKFFGGG
jgi:hypothetical protein